MTDPLTIPTEAPDGAFASFGQWVNRATAWIGGENALCLDAKDRVCLNGGDFMRARDEQVFPVRFWFGKGRQTPDEHRRNIRLARRVFRREHGFWP